MEPMELICRAVEQDRERYRRASFRIWDLAELAFEEKESAGLLCKLLEEDGFTVERGVAGLSTAFVGHWGTAGPVIGFLGEYDALPGLSQAADICRRRPLAEGAPGHGCGHHLLGVGALAAAVAAKRYLEATGLPGRVRYYGCPAEEGGAGKVYMATAGLFDDAAAALTWHPTAYNNIWSCNFLATRTITFRFAGVSAHATMQAALGRSALEAVELTSVGANYLRGHLPRDVFISYAVTDAGGSAPNIIPDRAEAVYMIRAVTQKQAVDAALRLYDVARGAAMMSGTTLEIEKTSGLSELVPNRSLERVMHRQFAQVGLPAVGEEDLDFAAQIRATLPKEAEQSTFANLRYLYGDSAEEIIAHIQGRDVEQVLYPYKAIPHPKFGSTDVCDVSWFVPTAQVTTACFAKDTPGHSWQYVAQGKRNLAVDGMLTAAKVMALTAARLYESPDELRAVREEFAAAMADREYLTPFDLTLRTKR